MRNGADDGGGRNFGLRGRMREIDHNHTTHMVRVEGSNSPSRSTTPIMADYSCLGSLGTFKGDLDEFVNIGGCDLNEVRRNLLGDRAVTVPTAVVGENTVLKG